MPYIEKLGILNGYSSQEENARKDVLGLTAVVTFFFPQIPSFFIYQRQKMGLAYCFLNSLCSPIILCSDRLFRILLFLFPAQHLILQFQK